MDYNSQEILDLPVLWASHSSIYVQFKDNAILCVNNKVFIQTLIVPSLLPAVVSVADETFKQSRRLMIILGSETFSCVQLEDASEQQLAMYSALIRDETQVILIEMDGTQDYASMPESIRYIKQKHGAIQWKGDFSEKSCSANTRFWKNVRYQMPAKKKVSFSEVYLSPHTLNDSAAKAN